MVRVQDLQVSTEIIKVLKPCQNRLDSWLNGPNKVFKGTIIDFLSLLEVDGGLTINDKLWVCLRLVPRQVAEEFAIDCTMAAQDYAAAGAASTAYAAAYAAADAAAYADADAAYAAAYADAAYAAAYNAADAAAYAAAAYNAAYAYADAYADAYAADAVAAAIYIGDDAAARVQERQRQIQALIWLIEHAEET